MKKILIILAILITSCNLSIENENAIAEIAKSEEIANSFYTSIINSDYVTVKRLTDTTIINAFEINKIKLRDSLFGKIIKYEIMKVKTRTESNFKSQTGESVVTINVQYEHKRGYYKERLLIKYYGDTLRIVGYDSEK